MCFCLNPQIQARRFGGFCHRKMEKAGNITQVLHFSTSKLCFRRTETRRAARHLPADSRKGCPYGTVQNSGRTERRRMTRRVGQDRAAKQGAGLCLSRHRPVFCLTAGASPRPTSSCRIPFCVCSLTGQGKQKIRDGSVSKNSAALYFILAFVSEAGNASHPVRFYFPRARMTVRTTPTSIVPTPTPNSAPDSKACTDVLPTVFETACSAFP